MRLKNVLGPAETAEGTYRLTLQAEDGVESTRTYKTKAAARTAKTKFLAKVARNEAARSAARLSDVPEFDGTLKWYTSVLGQLARHVAVCGDKEDRNNLKAVAQAAQAAAKLVDQSEYEERIDALERKTASVDSIARQGVTAIRRAS